VIPSWSHKKLKSSKRWVQSKIKEVDARLRMDLPPNERRQLSWYRRILETFLNNLKRQGKS